MVAWAGLLRQLLKAIKAYNEQIDTLARQHPDYALVKSFPGAGPALTPRLIAALGSQRDRYQTAHEIQCYSGIAPVVASSGKQRWVHWRWSCPTFLRQTFVEWVACSVPRSFWTRAVYESHRAKGASHNATVRALAFKWTRILYRCWVDRTPYNESRYLDALQKRRSPLLKFAAQVPL